ncbi:ADP-ribosylation factor [Tritrichomonas foetus]|uniref:ADP-ribosylation factor n=1 Tax=Tritrichomonas foetus TaxID=1144522 RepID=A0A1J4K6F7_9EUKA|nr:ADP-ribosylation factor [Tritrichomonas foetus]|eukprot:OHT06975.1 ADP-ribosylation factor [Tritrichomonas foetus]
MGCCCSRDVQELIIPVTVLGLPGVGKTSIIEFLADDYNPQDPPVGTNGIIQRQIRIHQNMYLFYDICGYTSHSDEWIDCCRKSEAVMIVFDPQSIQNAKMHNTNLFNTLSPIINDKKLPTLAILNKADEETQFDDVVDELKAVIPNVPLQSFKITALNKDVFQAFEWIESYTA